MTPTLGRGAIYLEKKGPIAELVLNRPEVLNAENWQMAHDFHAALNDLEHDRSINAVIVSGQDRAFSSGVDLGALARGELKLDWFRSFDEAMRRLELLDALTVAKIRGYAIGGGLQIALACDLRVATPDSQFGLPAVLEALIPGMGTYRLPRFVGLGRARRMALTGELVAADEALRIGLVDWIAPPGEIDAKVAAVIHDTLKGSAVARGFTKRLITASFESDYDAAFERYLEYQQQSLSSSDHQQAMRDYLRRKAKPKQES